jgi:hypothetical protein
VEATDFVLKAMEDFFLYSLRFYDGDAAAFAAGERSPVRERYEYQAQRFLAPALLHPPGSLKRPDWKALAKAEFEKRKQEEAKQRAEEQQ